MLYKKKVWTEYWDKENVEWVNFGCPFWLLTLFLLSTAQQRMIEIAAVVLRNYIQSELF